MQCIFRKENVGKARKYRLYRHLTTFEKIIKILMSFYHQKEGYLISFNFNQKKETGVREIRIGEKTIIEAVV